jgi:hypothetical protein
MEPTVNLFKEFFYVNKQTETASGRSQELGGVSFQRRRGTVFPKAELPSHPKGWNKTWFYCKNTAPEDEHPLPGYRSTRLPHHKVYPSKLTAIEKAETKKHVSRIRALVASGLTGVDLTRCWVAWQILPLSRRNNLIHTYTGETTDSQWYSSINLMDAQVEAVVQTLIKVSAEEAKKVGLKPFSASRHLL